jgi:tetratricopeptide (TPR) repeat protein
VDYLDENYEAARELHEEALATRREIGDLSGVAASLGNLGLVASARGDYEAARDRLEESLATSRDLGNKLFIAHSLDNLGRVAHARCDYAAARTLHEESLGLRRELGDKRGIAFSLEAFGLLAAATQQSERAARLFGAAEALREAVSVPLTRSERNEMEAPVAALRKAIGDEAFDGAWQAGRIMASESAIMLALE